MINVNQSEIIPLTLNIKDDNGTAIPLVGSTVFFMVKADLDDLDSEALINKSQIDHSATTGETVINLTKTDTQRAGNWFYDVTLANQTTENKSVTGQFNILQSVRRG